MSQIELQYYRTNGDPFLHEKLVHSSLQRTALARTDEKYGILHRVGSQSLTNELSNFFRAIEEFNEAPIEKTISLRQIKVHTESDGTHSVICYVQKTDPTAIKFFELLHYVAVVSNRKEIDQVEKIEMRLHQSNSSGSANYTLSIRIQSGQTIPAESLTFTITSDKPILHSTTGSMFSGLPETALSSIVIESIVLLANSPLQFSAE